jgi:hypothetical protein
MSGPSFGGYMPSASVFGKDAELGRMAGALLCCGIRACPYRRVVSVDSAPVAGASAPLAGTSPSRDVLSYWPPVAAWLAATGTVVAWCVAQGWPPFSATTTWSRWDSSYYLQIARHGYTLTRCGDLGGWCGNTAWFPAYPWLVGGFGHLGLPLAPAALVIAWLFGLGTLLLIWMAMPRVRPRGSLIAIAYAAVAPGVVYSYAVFPVSFLTFFTAAFLVLLARGRNASGGLAAGFAALSYPVGVVAAPAGALWLLTDRSRLLRERVTAAAVVLVPTVVALIVFVSDQRLETGRWNAFFLAQRHWNHHLRDPFTAVIDASRGLAHGRLFQAYHAVAIQTLLVTFVMAFLLAELFVRRHKALRSDWLVAIWAVATWVMALVQTNVSIWRSEAALIPGAILVRRLPASLAIAITAAALVVLLGTIRLFLRGLLI